MHRSRFLWAFSLILALFVLAACHSRKGDGISAPIVSFDVQAEQPFIPFGITIENPDSGATYTIVWDLAPWNPKGFCIAVPPLIVHNAARMTVSAPQGELDLQSGLLFGAGTVGVKVVKHKKGSSRGSKWFTFQILPSSASSSAFESIAANSARGIASAYIAAASDGAVLDGAILPGGGSIPLGTQLAYAACGARDVEKLETMALSASAGGTVVLGLIEGDVIPFDTTSVRMSGKFFQDLNGALAVAQGSQPPDPDSLPGFYASLGRDPNLISVENYALILAGATRMQFAVFERAIASFPFLFPEELGSLAWSTAASTAAFHALGIEALSGQAVACGKDAFDAADSLYEHLSMNVVSPKADAHFLPGSSSFTSFYGLVLSSAGETFADGAFAIPDFGIAIRKGFDAGAPLNGIVSSGNNVALSITKGATSYAVAAHIANYGGTGVPGVPVRLYVFGADGFETMSDATTNSSGNAVFADITNGDPGSRDIVCVVITGTSGVGGDTVSF
jgi:hypothetical protein